MGGVFSRRPEFSLQLIQKQEEIIIGSQSLRQCTHNFWCFLISIMVIREKSSSTMFFCHIRSLSLLITIHGDAHVCSTFQWPSTMHSIHRKALSCKMSLQGLFLDFLECILGTGCWIVTKESNKCSGWDFCFCPWFSSHLEWVLGCLVDSYYPQLALR